MEELEKGLKELKVFAALWVGATVSTGQTLGAPGASLVPREEFFLFYCVI